MRQAINFIVSLKLENNMGCNVYLLSDDNKPMPCEDVLVIKLSYEVLWMFEDPRREFMTSVMHYKVSFDHISSKCT